jgi:hypothetical protein
MMNTAVLEFPSICLRSLLDKNFSTCGSEIQLGHYSGNFWWANCDHVAQLDFPPNRFDWRKPEFFILYVHRQLPIRERFGHRCGYSVFNCGQNLYRHECPRSRYFPKIWQDVWNDTIGMSASNRGQATEEYLSVCSELRQRNVSVHELTGDLQKYFGH